MGATLSTLVGTPIIIGKIFLTLKLAKSAIRFVRFCTRLARLVTDPVVDVCVEILKEVVLLPMFSSFRALEKIAADKLHLPPSQPTHDGRLSKALSDLKSKGIVLYETQHAASVRLATSGTVVDRMWCMTVGYVVTIGTICLIAFAGEANLGRLSSGVVDQMKQHGKFLKLALFMALEMAVFPIIAGSAINFSLIPLFEGANVATRMEQLRHTPFGIIFVNWIIGTR
jgi:E3 ubiquitin-protein ligase MARCH6